MKKLLLLSVAFLCGSSFLFAQSAEKKEIKRGGMCADLDFWIGDWDVATQQGMKIASVVIDAGLPNHCVIRQAWHAGTEWYGIVVYFNETHDWRFVAASSTGTSDYWYKGLGKPDSIEYVADDPKPNTSHKLSYTKLPDGKVREFQQGSSDGGTTWKTEVDLIWTKK